jgi:hypothetical protein
MDSQSDFYIPQFPPFSSRPALESLKKIFFLCIAVQAPEIVVGKAWAESQAQNHTVSEQLVGKEREGTLRVGLPLRPGARL